MSDKKKTIYLYDETEEQLKEIHRMLGDYRYNRSNMIATAVKYYWKYLKSLEPKEHNDKDVNK